MKIILKKAFVLTLLIATQVTAASDSNANSTSRSTLTYIAATGATLFGLKALYNVSRDKKAAKDIADHNQFKKKCLPMNI